MGVRVTLLAVGILCSQGAGWASGTQNDYDTITTARFDSSLARTVTSLPDTAYRFRSDTVSFTGAATYGSVTSEDVVSPAVRRAAGDSDTTGKYIMSFRDNINISDYVDRVPPIWTENTCDSCNSIPDSMQKVVNLLRGVRSRLYVNAETTLDSLNATVLRRYWLIPALSFEISGRGLSTLIQRSFLKKLHILDIQTVLTAEPPPQAGANASSPGNPKDVIVARDSIASDGYFNQGLGHGCVTILDTGVRSTHVLLSGAGRLARARDCADDTTCNGKMPGDSSTTGHGTSTAAIITGRSDSLGERSRGVTSANVRSYNVWKRPQPDSLDLNATASAFQHAVACRDPVIVTEIQNCKYDLGFVAAMADNAFKLGAIVVAAVGNSGTSAPTDCNTPVAMPAGARGAIAVGDVNVLSYHPLSSQSYGTMLDGRTKPDIQAPTGTRTAVNMSDTSLDLYGATSGATPYAAGAALLLRNWLRGESDHVDPGQVYAQLILSGTRAFPFEVSEGAGPIELPHDGWGSFGKVKLGDVSENEECYEVDVPIQILSHDVKRIAGALWWFEEGEVDASMNLVDTRSNIDLRIVRPSGEVRDSSCASGVFERAVAEVDGDAAIGDVWHIRITAVSVKRPPQTVYWTAAQYTW